MTNPYKILLTCLFVALVACAPVPVTPHEVHRGDTRPPDQIKASGGFDSWAKTNGKTPDYDVLRHADRKHVQGKGSAPDGGLVSTTSDPNKAHHFVKAQGGTGHVYDVHGLSGAIDVNEHLGSKSPHPHEKEHVVHDNIPWNKVHGWRPVNGNHVGDKVTNPDFHRKRNEGASHAYAAR